LATGGLVLKNSNGPTIRVPESVRRQIEPSKMRQFAVWGTRQQDKPSARRLVVLKGQKVRLVTTAGACFVNNSGLKMLADKNDVLRYWGFVPMEEAASKGLPN